MSGTWLRFWNPSAQLKWALMSPKWFRDQQLTYSLKKPQNWWTRPFRLFRHLHSCLLRRLAIWILRFPQNLSVQNFKFKKTFFLAFTSFSQNNSYSLNFHMNRVWNYGSYRYVNSSSQKSILSSVYKHIFLATVVKMKPHSDCYLLKHFKKIIRFLL